MRKLIGLVAVLLLPSIAGCKIIALPIAPSRTAALPPPLLEPPTWLYGRWSGMDQGLKTETFTIGSSGVDWETSTFSLGLTSETSAKVSLSQWYADSGVELKPRWATPDTYTIDLKKDGQDYGFLRFESQDGAIKYTEKTPLSDRTVVLTGQAPGKAQPIPSPAPAELEKAQTPYFSYQRSSGWKEITAPAPAEQWEPVSYLQYAIAGVVFGTLAIDRTSGPIDLESVKAAWAANAGNDVLDVDQLELSGASAYLVNRVSPLQGQGSHAVIRKYLIPRDGRVYSFGLVYEQDGLFSKTILAEFDGMVKSVAWNSSSSADSSAKKP